MVRLYLTTFYLFIKDALNKLVFIRRAIIDKEINLKKEVKIKVGIFLQIYTLIPEFIDVKSLIDWLEVFIFYKIIYNEMEESDE